METYPVPLAFAFGISSPQLIIFTSTRGLLLSSTLWISISDTISWPCNTWPNITWILQIKKKCHNISKRNNWSVGNHWSVTCFWVALQQRKMHMYTSHVQCHYLMSHFFHFTNLFSPINILPKWKHAKF